MKTTFALLSSCCALALGPISLTAAPNAVQVVGNHLQDTVTGKTVQLTGVNIIGLDTSYTGGGGAPGFTINDTVAEALNVWKCNLIRLPVNENYWLDATNGPAYQSLIQSIVTEVSNANAYIIIDLHGNTSSPNMPDSTSATTFWPQVAAAYAGNPAVLFGLFNEPAGVTWSVWQLGGTYTYKTVVYSTPGMQALVDAVRSAGANNVVVAGTMNYCQDLSGLVGGYALTESSGNGIMYDAHIYPWVEPWSKGTTATTWAVTAQQFALLIGEFGHDGTDAGGSGTKFGGSTPMIYMPGLMGAIDALSLSSTAWSMHPNGGPALVNDWRTSPYSTYSVSGQFVKNHLLSYRDPAHASTAGNPGFETPATTSYLYQPTGATWSFTGNAGIQKTWGTAIEGAQTAFLQTAAAADGGSTGADGSVAQTISFASTGTYTVSFLLATRSGKSPLPITVSVDGTPISSVAYTPGAVTGANAFAPVTTAPFTINATGNHTITLAATASPGNDLEALVDKVTVAAVAPAVVQDEGFQLPALANGTDSYDPTSGAWTFTGNSGVEANALGAPTAPVGTGPHSTNFPQAAFLQTDAARAGSGDGAISESVVFAAPGAYSISIWAAQRSGYGALPVQVLLNGALIGTITPTSTAFAQYSTPSFVISYPGNYTVEFAATPSSGVDNEAFIDGVSVNVPATSTARISPVAVGDAGFETPSPAFSHGVQPTAGTTPWTFTGAALSSGYDAEIQSAGSSFGGYGAHQPAEGWQTAALQSDGTNAGTISQSVNFPAAGSYVITFQAQPGKSGAEPFTLKVDGTTVGSYTPSLRALSPYASSAFTVTAGAHTIEFDGGTATGTGVFTLIDAVNIWPATAPSFNFSETDIGAVSPAGSASVANGTYTLNTGSGLQLMVGWTSDAFSFDHQPVSGDCSLTARVATLVCGDTAKGEGAVMIRESLAADSAFTCMGVTTGRGVQFSYRSSTGATTVSVAGASVTAPYWVRLTRSGNTFTAYASADGITWAQVGTPQTIAMATSVEYGLAICNHGGTGTAMFDNVTSP